MAFTPSNIPPEYMNIVKPLFGQNTDSKTIIAAFKFLAEKYPKIEKENERLSVENEKLKFLISQIKEKFRTWDVAKKQFFNLVYEDENH